MDNKTSKILIETQEDKRLEVAIELAKTVNNLAELLKNMETSISNIHINGINVQTAQGETALQIGNNVKNTMVTNSIFKTDYENKEYGWNCSYDEDDCEDTDEDAEENENDHPIKVTEDENPLITRMKELGIWRKDYYNLTNYEKDGKYLVTAQQHWTRDFMIGEGDSLEEALKDLKFAINMYDKEFRSFYESLQKRFV